jgi:surface protein
MKFNNDKLKEAVKEWLEDSITAESKYGHISSWDTSEVTDMSELFSGAYQFNEDIANWNTSLVTDMSMMFYDAINFNQDIGFWDVKSVKNMAQMFCIYTDEETPNDAEFDEKLKSYDPWGDQDIPGGMFNGNIGKWDVSSVTSMSSMFYGQTQFDIDISSWNVSNVIDMASMFAFAMSFNQDIGQWDVSNVIEMGNMFYYASAGDISNWDTSKVTNMEMMFESGSLNGNIENWDVSSVKYMSQMFENTDFNQAIGKWDVINVESMEAMFYNNYDFNQDLENWNNGKERNHTLIFSGGHEEMIEKYGENGEYFERKK